MNGHLTSIRQKYDYPVARHFNNSPHSISEHFRFIPICTERNAKFRKHKESQLIRKFNTESPTGMNDRTDNIKRQSVVVPLVVPFSADNAKFCSDVKALAESHNIPERIVPAYTKHKSLKAILCKK